MKLLLAFLLCSKLLSAQSNLQGINYQGGFKEMNHRIYEYFTKEKIVPWEVKDRAKNRYFFVRFTIQSNGHVGNDITLFSAEDTTDASRVIAAIKDTDGNWINPGTDKEVYLLINVQFLKGDVNPLPLIPLKVDHFNKGNQQEVIMLPTMLIQESEGVS
jgi:hypothetical protein